MRSRDGVGRGGKGDKNRINPCCVHVLTPLRECNHYVMQTLLILKKLKKKIKKIAEQFQLYGALMTKHLSLKRKSVSLILIKAN